MLLQVLRWFSKPFSRRYVWLMVPSMLGAIVTCAGVYLLWPTLDVPVRPSQPLAVNIESNCQIGRTALIVPADDSKFYLLISSTGKGLESLYGDYLDNNVRSGFSKDSDALPPFINFSKNQIPECHWVDFYLPYKGDFLANVIGYGTEPGEFHLLGDLEPTKSNTTESNDKYSVVKDIDCESVWPLCSEFAKTENTSRFSIDLQGVSGLPKGLPFDDTQPSPVPLTVNSVLIEINCSDCGSRNDNRLELPVAINWQTLEEPIRPKKMLTHEVEANVAKTMSFRRIEWPESSIFAYAGTDWAITPVGQIDPFEERRYRQPEGLNWRSTASIQISDLSQFPVKARIADHFVWQKRSFSSENGWKSILGSVLLGIGITLFVEIIIVWTHEISRKSERSLFNSKDRNAKDRRRQSLRKRRYWMKK